MEHWYNWTQEEFILEFNEPCWIEPDYGWAIVKPNRLIYYSLGTSRTLFQPKPGLLSFIKKAKIITASKTISLRDSGEENYFHFYNDVLTKLFFLRKHGIDVHQYSIVVSGKLWDKPYFKYYLEHSTFLQSLTWVVQRDEYIHSQTTIFCKPLTNRKDLWSEVIQLVSPPISQRAERIFLTRSKKRLRFIENADEVEAALRNYGFRIVDADTLSLEEQIKLFSSASFLVGIHGAGLTNMVYREGNCSVLEIFPPPDLGYLPFHYILLASMKGFDYHAMIGEPGRIPYSGGFFLNIGNLEKELKMFL
jgi:capsular polysaccharide biosynthesis protein